MAHVRNALHVPAATESFSGLAAAGSAPLQTVSCTLQIQARSRCMDWQTCSIAEGQGCAGGCLTCGWTLLMTAGQAACRQRRTCLRTPRRARHVGRAGWDGAWRRLHLAESRSLQTRCWGPQLAAAAQAAGMVSALQQAGPQLQREQRHTGLKQQALSTTRLPMPHVHKESSLLTP